MGSPLQMSEPVTGAGQAECDRLVRGVLERVGEDLPGQPVRRDGHTRGQPGQLAGHLQPYLKPAPSKLGDQREHVGDARLRRQPQLIVVIAQQLQQPAGLRQRATTGRLHLVQGGDCGVRVDPDEVLRRGRLHRHDADAVREHVVQLPRHPRPFGRDRLPLGGCLPLLEQGRMGGEDPVAVGQQPHHPAEDVTGRQEHQREHDVGDVRELPGGGDDAHQGEHQRRERHQSAQIDHVPAEREHREPGDEDRRRKLVQLRPHERHQVRSHARDRADGHRPEPPEHEQRAGGPLNRDPARRARRVHAEDLHRAEQRDRERHADVDAVEPEAGRRVRHAHTVGESGAPGIHPRVEPEPICAPTPREVLPSYGLGIQIRPPPKEY